MTRILKSLRSKDYKWAINYLLPRIEDIEIAERLRLSNGDYPDLRNAINSLEKTTFGCDLIFKMQASLRQRRSREIKKYNESFTFTLPQETVNQIKRIAKINNTTEADAIAISVMDFNEITGLHSRQIKSIRATGEQKNIQLKEDIRSCEIKLNTALGILEDYIKQLLNKEMITSKPLPSAEEMEKLEEEVRKELDKRMRTARKYIEASGASYGGHTKNYRY